MQKFEFLRQPLLGELAMSRKKERKRERKKEKKMPFIVANYVSACSQGQRTHSARTNRKIYADTFGHLIDLDLVEISDPTLLDIPVPPSDLSSF